MRNMARGVGVKKHRDGDAGVLVATAADPKMPARPLLLLRCHSVIILVATPEFCIAGLSDRRGP